MSCPRLGISSHHLGAQAKLWNTCHLSKPAFQVTTHEEAQKLYPIIWSKSEAMQERTSGEARKQLFSSMASELDKLNSYLPPLEYVLSPGALSQEHVHEGLGDGEKKEVGGTTKTLDASSIPVTWHKYRYLQIGMDDTSARAFKIDVVDFLYDHPDLKK